MMPLNHILKKCTGGYKLHKSHEKKNQQINVHRRYQTVCQKLKRTGNTNTGHEDIQ